MVINTNIAALDTLNQLNSTQTSMNKSLQKLSSGYRINSAADDPAGLAISAKMLNQIQGLNQATSNSQDANSMAQTADGALNQTSSILQNMRQLAVQAASDTNTDSDRSDIQDEMDALVQQINQIAGDTEFNTKKLLDGSMGSAVTTAVANVQSNTALNSTTATTNDLVNLKDVNGNNLGITAGDTVNVSYMKNGTLVSNNTTVTAGTTLASLANSSDFTLAASSGTVTATAATAGTSGAIYGLTMTVTDSSGDQITNATNDLSNFTQTTAAQDVRENGSATIQIGANTNETMNMNIDNMDAAALGVQGLQVDTQQSAGVAIKVIDTATSMVTSQLSQLGAMENRLSSVVNNLSTSSENLSSAESNVRDVDMASEMANYTKLSVLSQAATSMLAQANALPQQVLKLLQ